MTIPSTTRKAGPLLGTGAQTAWPFTFKVFAEADIRVVVVNSISVETELVLDTDYSVSLNSNQDTSPGGTVTYPISGSPMPIGSSLVIVGDIDYDQPYDVPTGGNFNPTALENELDRILMQMQQLREIVTRALLAPVTSAASGQLPAPEANTLIGWNSAEDALQNIPLTDLVTAQTYGSFRNDPFTGDGVEDTFALSDDPVTVANLMVMVDGLVLVAGTDFSLASGNIVFTVPPANGAEIIARYGQALVSAGSDAADVSFTPSGSISSTDVQAAIEELDAVVGSATATGLAVLTAANAAAARTAIGAQASLGYTAADDSAVVKLTGSQTVAGVKTFSSQPILPQALATGTVVNTTSGTSVVVTGIPSWAKRVTIPLTTVGTSGGSQPVLRIGPSGGVETSGYLGATGSTAASSGAPLYDGWSGSARINGVVVLTLLNASTNLWAITGHTGRSDSSGSMSIGVTKALAGVLTQFSLTTTGGVDTFANGAITMYVEG
jgi:hypothetical protein